MKSKCFYIFLLLLLSCFPAISFGSEGVVSQQPSRNESKINADIRFKELEGNYSDLKSKFEEQQRVLKDDLGEIISIQDNKIISYADWTTITLACVAVLVTVLGVLIAILSVWGYKNIAREAKNSAEAVSSDISSRIAKEQVESCINQIAKEELAKLIDTGELRQHLEAAIDMIYRNDGLSGFNKFPEVDQEEKNE